jgi:hypothetical protein|tara:strand:+ start:1938 stop:2096 length:159 start_codon:yes stop_codon:yes gene_type:complete
MVNKFINPEIKSIDITDEQLQRMKDLSDNHNQSLESVIFFVIEHGLVALEKS